MKRLSLILLVLSFAITTVTMATDKGGKYIPYGVISCGEWVKGRKENDLGFLINASWISGYITAFNTKTPDVYNILGNTSIDSIWLWMDKYCQDVPLSDLPTGMQILTNKLWPNRKRTKHD